VTALPLPTFLSAKAPARPELTSVTASPEIALIAPPEIVAPSSASYVLLAAVAPVTLSVSAVMSAVRPVGWTRA